MPVETEAQFSPGRRKERALSHSLSMLRFFALSSVLACVIIATLAQDERKGGYFRLLRLLHVPLFFVAAIAKSLWQE